MKTNNSFWIVLIKFDIICYYKNQNSPTSGAEVLVIPPVTVTHRVTFSTLITPTMNHAPVIMSLIITSTTFLFIIMTAAPGLRSRNFVGKTKKKPGKFGVNVLPENSSFCVESFESQRST